MYKPVFRGIQLIYWSGLIFCAYLLIGNTLPYYGLLLNPDHVPATDFLLQKGPLTNNPVWKTAFFLHISGAMIALICGMTQFSRYIFKKYRALHRTSGKIYVIAVMIIAGPSGLYMSLFTTGGISAIIPFFLIAVLWLIVTGRAYLIARKGDFEKHGQWMIRSYALTTSAITFRVWAVFFGVILELEPETNYIISLWLSLIGNILVGEWVVYYYRNGYFTKDRPITE